MLGGGRGGGGGNPNLPNMYPNQQPQQGLGFYVPPPMNFEGQSMHQNPSNSNNSSMGDMLHNLLSSKPNFNAQIFGGNDKIYQSRYK